MRLQFEFCPALGDTIHSVVSSLSPQVLVLFSVRLSFPQHNHLVTERACVEVWANLPHSAACNPSTEWSSLPFSASHNPPSDTKGAYVVDLRSSASDTQDSVTLTAWTYFSTPPIDEPTRLSFTYRIVYPSGSIVWLGHFGQNGNLTIRSLKQAIPGFTLSPWHVDITREGAVCGIRWDVKRQQDVNEGDCVAHVSNMHDYLIWSVTTENILRIHQGDIISSYGSDTDASGVTASSILIFVHGPDSRRCISSPAFAVACSPGVKVALCPSSDSSARLCVQASQHGQVILEYDDMSCDPLRFISKILTHSGLVDRWNLVEHDEKKGSEPRAIVLAAHHAVNDRQHQFPIQVAVLPLLPSVAPAIFVSFDLDPVVNKIVSDGLVKDVAIFMADSPRAGFHVLADCNRQCVRGSGSIRLMVTVNREGNVVLFSPVHVLDGGARVGRRMKLVIVSPFSPHFGEDTVALDQPTRSTLPTPPPSPRPPMTGIIPPLSATVITVGDDADSELGTDITAGANSSPAPGFSAADSSTAPSTPGHSTADPAPSSESGVIPRACPSKQRRLATICPSFSSLLAVLKSILLSVTAIFRLFYGILDAPRRRFVHTGFRIPFFNRSLGVWRLGVGRRREGEDDSNGQTRHPSESEADLCPSVVEDPDDVGSARDGPSDKPKDNRPSTEDSSSSRRTTPEPSSPMLTTFAPPSLPTDVLIPEIGAGTEYRGETLIGAVENGGDKSATLSQGHPNAHRPNRGPVQQLVVRTRSAADRLLTFTAAVFQDEQGQDEDGEETTNDALIASDGTSAMAGRTPSLPNVRILDNGRVGVNKSSATVSIPKRSVVDEISLAKYGAVSDVLRGARGWLVDWCFDGMDVEGESDLKRRAAPADEIAIQIEL